MCECVWPSSASSFRLSMHGTALSGVFSVNDKQKFISQRIQIWRQLSGESVNLDRNQRTREIYILISLGAEEPCFI